MARTPHLDGIIDFVKAINFNSFPEEVVDRAGTILLDTVGCALGGSMTSLGTSHAKTLIALAGYGKATAIGVRGAIDPVTAAFLNSTLSDALDYEDTLIAHPSAVVIPAALALGETVGATRRELVEAIVAGYEVSIRVARAIMPSVERQREVAVGYAWGAFGAVTAAAHLLQLSEDEMRHAFGYAGAASPLPIWISKWARPLQWLKNNFGEQTRAGVLGALMARGGFRGPERIFDSEYGFWRMVGSDRFDPGQLSKGLGRDYEILQTEFKPYPACRFLHTTIEVIQDLIQDHQVGPEAVEKVTVRSFRGMTEFFGDRRPDTLVDAQFSLPYSVAVALMGVPVGADWYHPRTLKNPALLAIADRVRIETTSDDDFGFAQGIYPTEVHLLTNDGNAFTGARDVPLGSRMRPMSRDSHRIKFMTLAAPVLSEAGALEAWTHAQRFEPFDLQAWMKGLIPSPSASLQRLEFDQPIDSELPERSQ